MMKPISKLIFDHAMNEANKDAGFEQKKCGGKNENWLVALAKAMSSVQSEHLNKLLQANKDMQDNTGESEASREKFIDAQGRAQAESQLFKLSSEATSTAIKSIGEGLSSIARKQ